MFLKSNINKMILIFILLKNQIFVTERKMNKITDKTIEELKKKFMEIKSQEPSPIVANMKFKDAIDIIRVSSFKEKYFSWCFLQYVAKQISFQSILFDLENELKYYDENSLSEKHGNTPLLYPIFKKIVEEHKNAAKAKKTKNEDEEITGMLFHF